MNGLIRETNENLKTIINTMKENLDSAVGVLDNIQSQMDKKVEEAKKYKIQVDSAKEEIRNIEEDNKNLELSLNELNEKYSKLNLVSLIEAGNKEIKAKINDNNKLINKNKEQIAELTSKARTIKDLLINLKKDKTAKEERLENLKKVYEFYSKNLNEIIDFAYEHSDNLDSFNYQNYNINSYEEDEDVESYNELENTMVFDEIADIDENDDFKDEITFINNEIDNNIINNDNTIADRVNNMIDNEEREPIIDNDEEKTEEDELEPDSDINLENLESTKVFDSIMTDDYNYDETEETSEVELEKDFLENDIELEENINEEPSFDTNVNIDTNIEFEDLVDTNAEIEETFEESESINEELNNNEFNINISDEETIDNIDLKTEENTFNLELENKKVDTFDINENTQFDLTTNNRINEINDLLTNIENTKTETMELGNIEDKIDNVLKKSTITEAEKESTLTDIFGNPIKAEQIDESIVQTKKIEEMFVENGVDFNKFKEDEQNYLKQIYDENKFIGIFNVLNKNKINVDNLYHSFNIFGEIDAIELDIIINKLISIGQSVEVIGIILEKMPKIKKYNLDEAIASFNDEIKNVNIAELIMKAKELYNGGNK